MGNDGGSIPKRRELVKSAARAPNMSELKATALESLSHAWSHCALTSEPLDSRNVVSDWRGKLYNYESVLKGLMPEAGAPSSDVFDAAFEATGIKSLRDIQKLHFKLYTPAGKEREVWACPVSLKELGPSTKAVYVVPCGHVFADVVFKEVKDNLCPECGSQFDDKNLIPVLPIEEVDVKRLFDRIDGLRAAGLTHTLKRDKSNGKKKRKAAEEKETEGATLPSDGTTKPVGKSNGNSERSIAGINNAMAASLTARVLAEQGEKIKKRKMGLDYKASKPSRV